MKLKIKKKKHVTMLSNIIDCSNYTDNGLNGFLNEYEQNEKTKLTGEITDIYLGLDFGTSYTKVAFQKSRSDRGILDFGNSHFMPSVVFYNNNKRRLSFFEPKTDAGYTKILFFKATMVNKSEYDSLRYNDGTTPENFEFLCSVFFLANVIRFCKNKIGAKYNLIPNLYITMGIPLFDNEDDEVIYSKALHSAIQLAEENMIWDMGIDSLQKKVNFAMTSFDKDNYDLKKESQNGTMPELFAESFFIISQRDFGPGFYFIIDIGGGTADFAILQKDTLIVRDRTEYRYYCPSYLVAPLGNEVRKKAEAEGYQAERVYNDSFAKTYRSTISLGKLGLQIEGKFHVTRLMFGGGALETNQPYQRKEPHYYRYGLKSTISCSFSEGNVPAQNIFGLSQDDYQRLITAIQLATPANRINYLNGYPRNYDYTYHSKEKKDLSVYDPGYDDIG